MPLDDDSLEIRASLDASQVQAGQEVISSSMKELASNVLEASSKMEAAFEALANGPGIQELLTKLGAVGEEATTAAANSAQTPSISSAPAISPPLNSAKTSRS